MSIQEFETSVTKTRIVIACLDVLKPSIITAYCCCRPRQTVQLRTCYVAFTYVAYYRGRSKCANMRGLRTLSMPGDGNWNCQKIVRNSLFSLTLTILCPS